MTDLCVLQYVSLQFPITSDNMYPDRCGALTPEYSKCDTFARVQERGLCKIMCPDILFVREHRFVMFWWKGVPQQKKSSVCKSPALLSFFSFIFFIFSFFFLFFSFLFFSFLSYLYIYLFICPSFYLPIYLSICPSVLSIYLSIYLFIYLSFYLLFFVCDLSTYIPSIKKLFLHLVEILLTTTGIISGVLRYCPHEWSIYFFIFPNLVMTDLCSYGTCPSNSPSQVIICILTDVALWLPEYSKCDKFASMEKRGLRKNMLPDIRFLRRTPCCDVLVRGSPTTEILYIYSCTPPTLLSFYLTIYLLNFFGLWVCTPSIKDVFLALRKSPQKYW